MRKQTHDLSTVRGYGIRGLGLYLALAATSLIGGAGCTQTKTRDALNARASAVEIRQSSEGQTVEMSILDLQARLMGFADGFAVGLRAPLRVLSEELGDAQRANLSRWNDSHSGHAYVIASGPNPVVNLLDLASLATLARIVLEDYWIPEVFGEAGRVLLEFHVRYEKEIWTMVKEVLPPDKQKDLMELILKWREDHPHQRFASFVSIAAYARERWRSPLLESRSSRSVLSMLYLDPLARLDPAMRQIAQTRYTAERVIYYLQRAPSMVRFEAQTLLDELSRDLNLSQVVADLHAFRLTSAELTETLNNLPARLASEQTKVLDQFVAQQDGLSTTVQEFQAAFAAGAEMASSVDRAVQTLDGFLDEDDPTPETTNVETPHAVNSTISPAASTSPPRGSRPFDVLEYAEAAERISEASTNLTTAIQSLDGFVASPAWDARQRDLEGSAERIIQKVFVQGLILVGAAVLGALVVIVVYRRFGHTRAKETER